MELSSDSQGRDEAGPFRNKKKSKRVVYYTSIKKVSKRASKIIKIEVIDGKSVVNDQKSCDPEISVQYVAESIFDNVYCDIRRIIKNIQDSMCSE